MSSENRRAANGHNAKRSTGPRSKAGKDKAAQNALAHGLCATRPVLPGEPADDWDRHRAGVLASLQPVGGLEDALAERVALCLWRLRRVAAYETAVTVAGLEEVVDRATRPGNSDATELDPLRLEARRLRKAEKELAETRKELAAATAVVETYDRLADPAADGPVDPDVAWAVLTELSDSVPGATESFDFEDEDFLAGVGVPPEFVRRAHAWAGWTVVKIRQAAAVIAAEFESTLEVVIDEARTERSATRDDLAEKVDQFKAEVAEWTARVDALTRRSLIRKAIPDADTLAKLTRYESHLSRQMLQALHTLERLQAARSGQAVPPPAAVDVTVESSLPAADDG